MALSIHWTPHFVPGVVMSSDHSVGERTQNTGCNKEIENGVYAEIIRTATAAQLTLREAGLPDPVVPAIGQRVAACEPWRPERALMGAAEQRRQQHAPLLEPGCFMVGPV